MAINWKYNNNIISSYNLVILAIICATVSGHNICESNDHVYQIPGDVSIIGLIGLHKDENCSQINEAGNDILRSVIETVQLARMQNILSDLEIGLTVYDTCSQQELVQKSIVSALVEAECTQTFVIGAISDEGLHSEAVNLSQTLQLPVTVLQTDNINNRWYTLHLINETVRLILDTAISWLSTIDYLITSDIEEDLTKRFLDTSMKSGICIKKRLNSTENLASIERKSTVLIMAKSENIADLLRTIAEGVNILIAPLDGKYEPLQDIKAEHILIVLPSMTTFSTNINYTYFENVDEEILSRTEMSAVYSYRHYQIVSDILHLLENIKIYIKKHCNDLSICQSLPRITNNYTLPKISSSLINKLAKILKISSDASICTLLEQTTDGRLMNITSKDDDSSTIESDNIVVNRNHYDNSCINFFIRDSIDFNEVYSREGSVKMRGDSWVAALLSVCAVGIACCLAISVFIVVRLCKGDMLEGNPGFSFLMLFSMIIMYAAVLPYSFEVVDDHHYYTGVICGIKAIGTSLSYSLVFSVMLSRSVMLASCDEDGGFMSHVNGYLQTILCFFIAAVQIALTLQFWSINWLILTKEQCSAMTEGPLFLYLLTYDMFLLFLLLCMSPFIIRSKRNYHEGGYFAVSTFLCLLVWVGWTTGYALLPSWSDLFICVGLMATASVVLISVFIPRTYLMLTGIVRDHIVSTLPHSLSHTTTTSVLDVNYRSTQALYDSVNTSALLPPSSGLLHPTAQVNPNYYAERPTTPSTSKLEDRTTSAASNLYERYERSPSPLNVTRF